MSEPREQTLNPSGEPSYLASRALVSVPISGMRAKPYESAGTSKCLAPYKLHAKSLAILETCEFLSLSHRYPAPRRLYSHNNSLSYQFSLTERLYLLAPAFHGSDTENLKDIRIWSIVCSTDSPSRSS